MSGDRITDQNSRFSYKILLKGLYETLKSPYKLDF